MLFHANGTKRVNISDYQILIVSGRVLKQCYLHTNMDADFKQQCCIVHIIIISVLITGNYWKCMLLFS